jgi:hypothetical protein
MQNPNKLALLLLLLLVPVTLLAGKTDELIPEYQIVKNERDQSLSTKEAVFIFTFTNLPGSSKITASCNSLQKTITTTAENKFTFKTKPGKYKFQLFYTNEYFEIYTDNIKIEPGFRIEIDVNFQSSLYPVIMDKPVIYCYPKEKTSIHIDLGLKGNMLFTYPLYKNGWDFVAEPNGTITTNEKQFKYLFWEGETNINYASTKFNEGSIVENVNLLMFLETSLTQMGMNSNEQQDFITYWFPLMQKNEKNYIHFVFNEDYNEYASMNIFPKPDNSLRVYMLWCDAGNEKNPSLQKQEIPSLKREGFTLVEWGGSMLSEIPRIDL